MGTLGLIERMYAAAGAADMETLRSILAEDVVIEEPPFLPYGGTHRGFDAFVRCFAQASLVIDLARLELDGVTADDEHAYGRVRVPLADGSGEATILEEWTVREGRVVAARVFWFDAPPT